MSQAQQVIGHPALPPGPNPRGQRPYVFAGDYYGDPIPGVVGKAGRWSATADAAWLLYEAGLRMTAVPAPAEAPIRFKGFLDGLFPYQRAGVEWLAAQDYAVLSDEMGLGKTVQTLKAAELRLSLVRGVSGDNPHVLVLCPALAKRHWAREIKRWTGWEAAILDGLAAGPVPRARYVVANYDILYGQRRRDAAGKLGDIGHLAGWGRVLAAQAFPIVICDEAHGLRGQKSRRTEAVKATAEHSTCVWMLSGTPMPNHIRDLWSLWDLASNGLAGYFWPWAKAYCAAYKSQYGWTADGRSRLDELAKRLSFWMLGRTKAQVGLQLPEKRREVVQVEVAPVKTRTDVSEGEAFALTISKQNVVAAALRATAVAKQPAVIEMAQEALDAGQKVVVFVWLREAVELIGSVLAAGALNGATVIAVSGAMSPEGRDKAAQAFREHVGPAAFVATIDSVGVAISLVGADLVVFGDLSYEPAKLLQAEGRAHRVGSTNRVLVRYVVAAGTVDDEVAAAVVEKLDTMAEALGAVADGGELAGQLGRGQKATTEEIVGRLFAKLTGGAA